MFVILGYKYDGVSIDLIMLRICMRHSDNSKAVNVCADCGSM